MVVFNRCLDCLLICINVLRVESVTMMHKRAFYLRALFNNGLVFAISVPSNWPVADRRGQRSSFTHYVSRQSSILIWIRIKLLEVTCAAGSDPFPRHWLASTTWRKGSLQVAWSFVVIIVVLIRRSLSLVVKRDMLNNVWKVRSRTKYELSFVATAYYLPVEFGPVRFVRKIYSLVVERVLVHVSVLLLV